MTSCNEVHPDTSVRCVLPVESAHAFHISDGGDTWANESFGPIAKPGGTRRMTTKQFNDFVKGSLKPQVFRATDPLTSVKAAQAIEPNRGTQQATLLAAYRQAGDDGLTDEEACDKTGFSGGWKRCSELRNAGLIIDSGKTRLGRAGVEQMVCVASNVRQESLTA